MLIIFIFIYPLIYPLFFQYIQHTIHQENDSLCLESNLGQPSWLLDPRSGLQNAVEQILPVSANQLSTLLKCLIIIFVKAYYSILLKRETINKLCYYFYHFRLCQLWIINSPLVQ